MAAGAFAGMFATVLTHPIDVVRAKLTVQSHQSQVYKGTYCFKHFVCCFKPPVMSMHPLLDGCMCMLQEPVGCSCEYVHVSECKNLSNSISEVASQIGQTSMCQKERGY